MAQNGISITTSGTSFTQFTPSYQGVIARYLSQTDVLSKGLVYLQDIGFNGKFAIPTARIQNVFQTYAVTPDPNNAAGQVSYTDKFLDVTNTKVDVFMKFNPLAFVGYWKEFQNPDQPFNYRTLPAQVQATMVSLLLNQTAAGVDEAILVGSTSLTGSTVSAMKKSFNGIFTKAATDSETYKVSGATTLTSANIISELQRAIRQSRGNNQFVRQATYSPDFKIMMSYNTWQLYSDAIRNLTYKGASPVEANPTSIGGISIAPCAYAPDGHFIGAIATNSPTSDLWVGVSTIGDLSNIKVDRLTNYSDEFFLRMTMALDAQIVRPEQVFYY